MAPFTSTRDPELRATFREALLSGYASDGGLFVPRFLPAWSREELVAMQSLSYVHVAEKVLRAFVPTEEVTDDDLKKVLAAAYRNFDPANVVCVKKLPTATSSSSSCGTSTIFVSELFHGPTQCFKDLGLGVVVAFLSHFTPKEESSSAKRRTLVVSTTGDTGPAAVHAVVSAANPLLNILITYPKGQISEYQRKQMTTVVSPNVKVCEFEGGGDDMDVCIKVCDFLFVILFPITLPSCIVVALHSLSSSSSSSSFLHRQKAMATDEEFKDKYGLCGVNSYNIGRPLAQTVHILYFLHTSFYFLSRTSLTVVLYANSSSSSFFAPHSSQGALCVDSVACG